MTDELSRGPLSRSVARRWVDCCCSPTASVLQGLRNTHGKKGSLQIEKDIWILQSPKSNWVSCSIAAHLLITILASSPLSRSRAQWLLCSMIEWFMWVWAKDRWMRWAVSWAITQLQIFNSTQFMHIKNIQRKCLWRSSSKLCQHW